jgi:hypothetical protein
LRALAAAALTLAWGIPAEAKQSPVTVLLWAPVNPAASSTMAPAVWQAIVTRYVDAEKVLAAAHDPAIADCRAAKALYIVKAPFELSGADIARSVDQNGRLLGRTHVSAINCITTKSVFDGTIDLTSAAPASSGDLENTTDVSWDSAAQAQLARHPLPLYTISRIVSIHEQYAYIDVPAYSLGNTAAFRVFAHANGDPAEPAILPVIDLGTKLVSLLILGSQPKPQVGDYVEPVAATTVVK